MAVDQLLQLSLDRALRKRFDHFDVGRTKNFPFAVNVLYVQNYGRTNNCIVEVFLKWSDQSGTPSTNGRWAPGKPN